MKDNNAIRYLSLAAKAGVLVTGGDEVDKALRRRSKGLLIVASDAGADARRRAEMMTARSGSALLISSYTKREIAAAVGRGNTVAFALVTDRGLASAFAKAAGNGTEQEDQV